MKAQLRVKAKSSTVTPKKPSDRVAKLDAWTEWLAAIAAEGLDVAEVLAEPSTHSTPSTFSVSAWEDLPSDSDLPSPPGPLSQQQEKGETPLRLPFSPPGRTTVIESSETTTEAPPSPQTWGSQTVQRPPELGDLGGIRGWGMRVDLPSNSAIQDVQAEPPHLHSQPESENEIGQIDFVGWAELAKPNIAFDDPLPALPIEKISEPASAEFQPIEDGPLPSIPIEKTPEPTSAEFQPIEPATAASLDPIDTLDTAPLEALEEPERAIAEPQSPSWFHSKDLASDAPDAPPDDPNSIEQAIAHSQPMALPFKAILESRLGHSLDAIDAYGGTPEIRATLDQLDARAALYDQQILFAEPQPDLETVTHEVIHALQAQSGEAPSKLDVLPTSDAAEREAHLLTQEVVQSVERAESTPILWAPIAIHSTLYPGDIARLRESPPPTVGENAQPGEILETTAERGDRTPAPTVPAAPIREPEPSEAQAETEAALAEGELNSPVSGELEEVPALEAPTPPEPGITEADVAAREAEMAQAEAALANATDVDDKVAAYAAAPPTLKAQEQSSLGTDLDALTKSENASFQEEIPDFQVTLSGETEELPELQVEAPPAGEVSLEAVPPDPAPDPDIPPTPDPVAYTANESILRVISRFSEGNSPQDRAGDIGETLNDVRTTDPDVETSPGDPPAVPLEGETDPERIANQLQEGRDQATQARDDAQQAVVNGPGPERVQPLVIEEAVPLGELVEPALTQPEPVAAIEDFNQREMPPEVNTAFDLNNQDTMQASMADAQAQVQQTTEERDRTRQEQLDTAQQEADRQTLEADQGQRDAVQDQRDRIHTERQTTLEDQAQAVRDIEGQAETRRNTERDAIDDRVHGDQEAISRNYQQAERDADAKVSGGERDAEAERRDAEREAENQSWWDRAVSFVQEAFAALTSAISAIFDRVRAAINKILDDIKAAAEALINLAANFIKNAIAAFGDFLKGLVDGLLGELFPELATALNELIDEAVQLAQQAVDAVAETLRNGINMLVEGLRNGLNAVLDVMQAGLELASSLIQAALAGDWGAVIRLLLEAVLKVVGIEPETFYGFIGRAEETLQKILDDPGAVVGYLLDAVKLGIQQFADNFLPHLQTGIIGWLVGAIGDLEIPTEFNLIGVLDLARQIMGLTLQFIRRIAVRLIGEENVERIEALFGYVETLIAGGWSALFEQITESLGNLRDMVLDQIKEFLVTRLILAAITKLVTMFNPIGAIVQLVLTAWNIYTFLRDNLQRMIQIVQSIVEGISNIVNGVIAPAATRIEETLANLLPIAISFLANLLGIGGIANRVRQIIDSVRDRIENAIVTFIQRIASRFTGRGRSAGATEAPEAPREPEGTAEGTSGDVQDRARTMVAQQLRGDHDEAEIQTILNQIHNQLRADGLRAIVLGVEAADGSREILTEASPRRRAARLVPKRSRGRVRMFVTIRLRGAEPALPDFPNVPGTQRPVRHLRANESGDLEDVTDTSALAFEPVEGVTAAPRRGASRRQQGQRQRSGGVVFRPDEDAPNEVRTASWSTGEDPDSRSNRTHAEHQFVEWLDRQTQDFKQRVESIEIRIEKSPCRLCVSNDLARLLTQLIPSAEIAILDYEETYFTPPNETTQGSLSQLRGWRVTGPHRGEPPPSGDENEFVLDDR